MITPAMTPEDVKALRRCHEECLTPTMNMDWKGLADRIEALQLWFTREDVELLRKVPLDWSGWDDEAVMAVERALENLADRIEALLPPEDV